MNAWSVLLKYNLCTCVECVTTITILMVLVLETQSTSVWAFSRAPVCVGLPCLAPGLVSFPLLFTTETQTHSEAKKVPSNKQATSRERDLELVVSLPDLGERPQQFDDKGFGTSFMALPHGGLLTHAAPKKTLFTIIPRLPR